MVTKKEFLSQLEDNEDCMGEGAAFSVTCEMFGLELDDGYALLTEEDK